MCHVLINGVSTPWIPWRDRGFHYGDGVFETIAVHNGRPRQWAAHLRRLQWGCERLGIRSPATQDLEREVARLCRDTERAVIKLVVTAGPSGRGYRRSGGPGTRLVALFSWPQDWPWDAENGIRLRRCATPVSINPRLAGIKHLNRLEQILARQEWNDPQIPEGLMLTPGGQVISGTMTNLFLVLRGRLVTPRVSECGIAGVLRGQVLELAGRLGFHPQVIEVYWKDLSIASEVFVTNSLIGVCPVRSVDQWSYSLGPVTRRLISALESDG